MNTLRKEFENWTNGLPNSSFFKFNMNDYFVFMNQPYLSNLKLSQYDIKRAFTDILSNKTLKRARSNCKLRQFGLRKDQHKVFLCFLCGFIILDDCTLYDYLEQCLSKFNIFISIFLKKALIENDMYRGFITELKSKVDLDNICKVGGNLFFSSDIEMYLTVGYDFMLENKNSIISKFDRYDSRISFDVNNVLRLFLISSNCSTYSDYVRTPLYFDNLYKMFVYIVDEDKDDNMLKETYNAPSSYDREGVHGIKKNSISFLEFMFIVYDLNCENHGKILRLLFEACIDNVDHVNLLKILMLSAHNHEFLDYYIPYLIDYHVGTIQGISNVFTDDVHLARFINCMGNKFFSLVHSNRLFYFNRIRDCLDGLEKKFYLGYTLERRRHRVMRGNFERKMLKFKQTYGYVELLKIVDPFNGIERRKRRCVSKSEILNVIGDKSDINPSVLESICYENFIPSYVNLIKQLKNLHPSIQQNVFGYLDNVYYVQGVVYNNFPYQLFINL